MNENQNFPVDKRAASMQRGAKFGAIRPLYSFGFAAAFAALACIVASPTGSMSQTSSPRTGKQVEVQITGPSSVMVGGPVLLKYRLTNRLKNTVGLDGVGDATRTWVRLELRDGEGKPLYSEPTRKRPSLTMGIGDLSFGEATEGTVIASPQVLPKSPGRYTLRANVSLSYTQRKGNKIIGEMQTVRSVTDVPITATPTDDASLTKMACDLRNRFLAEQGDIKEVVLSSLFSMKESAALPAWRSLLDDPNLEKDGYGAGLLGKKLGELATPASVDFLIRMWGGDPNSPYPGAKGSLQKMYIETKGASLKAHIRKGFEAVSGSPTDLYDGPIIVNDSD